MFCRTSSVICCANLYAPRTSRGAKTSTHSTATSTIPGTCEARLDGTGRAWWAGVNDKLTADLKARLEETLKRHEEELCALGEKVRAELVIPACRKHRLTFTSGMGTFFFSKGEHHYGNRDDVECGDAASRALSAAAKATIAPILDLLNEEISHNNYLGYYVTDAS